jgi:hypothetical protein
LSSHHAERDEEEHHAERDDYEEEEHHTERDDYEEEDHHTERDDYEEEDHHTERDDYEEEDHHAERDDYFPRALGTIARTGAIGSSPFLFPAGSSCPTRALGVIIDSRDNAPQSLSRRNASWLDGSWRVYGSSSPGHHRASGERWPWKQPAAA